MKGRLFLLSPQAALQDYERLLQLAPALEPQVRASVAACRSALARQTDLGSWTVSRGIFISRNMVNPDMTDAELVEAFASEKSGQAFAELVRRHGGMVMAVSRRILGDRNDAEDVFQAAFLVLARKAGSLRRADSLGSWLYGVALHLAMRQKRNLERRRMRETEAAMRSTAEAGVDETWEQVRPILDEEVARLPEKYRAPLVLCDLEGQSHERAASELDCPRGTVWKRLVRAREILRDRLGRRGVALTGALLGTLLAERAASALVPSGLLATTLKAGAGGAAALASVVRPEVMGLLEGGLKAMFLAKMKLAAGVFLALGVGGTAAAVTAYHALSQSDREEARQPEGGLPRAEFDRLHRELHATEVWQTIPWLASIREARDLSTREKKPIYMYICEGHPLAVC